LGLGFWVLGFGVWAKNPNPQSPIPNPQSPLLIEILLLKKLNYKIYEIFNRKNNKKIININTE